MAYNNNFYGGYPQFYPQNPQIQMPQQPQVQPQTQVQNGGFMLVPSEDIARSYPVAPGNCVTFKIEGKPIVMEKSMGFSQLEAPRIEKYKLVREDEPVVEMPVSNQDDEIRKIWDEIDVLKKQAEQAADFIKRTEDCGA